MRGLLFLCLLGSAFAGIGMVSDRLLKKYSYIKILSSCFGDEVLESYMEKFKAAAQKCHTEIEHNGDTVTHSHEHTHIDGTVHTHEHTHQKGQEEDHDHDHAESTKPVAALPEVVAPVNGQQFRIQYVPVPYTFPYGLRPGKRPFAPFPGMQIPLAERNKRHADDNKGQKYIDRIIKKAESMQCTLQELNYVDEEGQPKVESMKAELDELNITTTLKDDLHKVVDQCYDFANCLPAEKAKHPLVQKLGRTVAFMKCIKMKEIMACMRQDFIKYAHKEGLDGNDEKVFELIMTFGEGKEDPDFF